MASIVGMEAPYSSPGTGRLEFTPRSVPYPVSSCDFSTTVSLAKRVAALARSTICRFCAMAFIIARVSRSLRAVLFRAFSSFRHSCREPGGSVRSCHRASMNRPEARATNIREMSRGS